MKELQELRKELLAETTPRGAELVERLFDLLEQQIKRCDRLEKENEQLRQRIAELEERNPPASPQITAAPPESYSLDAEEKRRRRKQREQRKRQANKKNKSGRKQSKDKLECVVRWEDIVPEGACQEDCVLQSERPVWRIEAGKAIRAGYRVYRLPWQETPRVPGVLPRCEYGIEIHVLLAYLVYVSGISIDKACQLLRFFCQLPLEASQADAMLTQLGKQWNDEFDTICEQIALAAVVYTDETSWRVGRLNRSLWSFTSEFHCVMLFGCSKDRKTLESILPPELFDGVLVSDDAAVYREGYRSQKCWAHLLRKAIKLVLLDPEHSIYSSFLDELLAIYRDAKRASQDNRLSEKGRLSRVGPLEGRLCDICHPHWSPITAGLPARQIARARLTGAPGGKLAPSASWSRFAGHYPYSRFTRSSTGLRHACNAPSACFNPPGRPTIKPQNSRPHTDSRRVVFDAVEWACTNGNLLYHFDDELRRGKRRESTGCTGSRLFAQRRQVESSDPAGNPSTTA